MSVIVVQGKLYATCQTCGSLVRLNKPLLGSLHLCYHEGSER